MNFTDALSAVFNDADRVTRRVWNNRQIFCCLEDGKLCLKGHHGSGRDDGLYHPWTITEQDYFADDWEIVTDA